MVNASFTVNRLAVLTAVSDNDLRSRANWCAACYFVGAMPLRILIVDDDAASGPR